MKTPEQVNSLINCLTNDEDQRQELWLHYLSGNPVDTFARHLESLAARIEDEKVVRETLWFLLHHPPSEKFQQFLTNFTDFERSIIITLMLGLSIEKISKYKGISEVRIRQAIASIRYNSCWETYYGTEEKLNRRRKTRTE